MQWILIYTKYPSLGTAQ